MRFLFLIALLFSQPAQAQPNHTYYCNGQFDGLQMQGQLAIQHLSHSDTYGYYGTFTGADRNRYDFEVISNQNGGLGGAWKNGARHRETRIEMRTAGNSFSIVNLYSGESGRFLCQ